MRFTISGTSRITLTKYGVRLIILSAAILCLFLILSENSLKRITRSAVFKSVLPYLHSDSKAQKLFAALATDKNVKYIFPMPITVLAYRRLGVRSIVVLIGDEIEYTSSKKFRIILDLLRLAKAQIFYIKNNKIESSTLAQVVRIYVAALPGIEADDDAFLFTADADLIPFTLKDHLPQHGQELFLYNSRCCGKQRRPGEKTEYPQYGIPNLLARVSLWRRIMNISKNSLTSGDTLEQWLFREFGEDFAKGSNAVGSKHWFMDQVLVSSKIHSWRIERENNSQLIGEYVGLKRIDRARWPRSFANISLDKYLDAHLLRPLHSDKNWKRTVGLFKKLFDNETFSTIEKYRKEFNNAIK